MDDLVSCCVSSNTERFNEIISDIESPDNLLNNKPSNGKTLLELASTFGCLPIIEELIKIGGDVNFKSEREYTLLHWAASWGNIEVVKFLVNAGTSIGHVNVHGETARTLAERYDQGSCSEYLNKAEKLDELKKLALHYKDVVNDPEKNMGRFNKEDKIYGNRYCDEKLDWLEANRDISSLQTISGKIDELKNQLKNSMSKLQEQS